MVINVLTCLSGSLHCAHVLSAGHTLFISFTARREHSTLESVTQLGPNAPSSLGHLNCIRDLKIDGPVYLLQMDFELPKFFGTPVCLLLKL